MWPQRDFWSYQVVVGFDAEQISEVAEGQRGVGLEAEVWVVMSRRQVASLTGMCHEKPIPEKVEIRNDTLDAVL